MAFHPHYELPGGFEVECWERFREGWGRGKLVLSDGEIITEV